ncbi:MAG: hypothetical protein ACI9N1_001628 [Flavobacteriales bacterium]|jgi:hypothetical protein
MKRIIELLFLITISNSGYGQLSSYSHCDSTKMILVDSSGMEMEQIQGELIPYTIKGTDSILLKPLYDLNFTRELGSYPFGEPQIKDLLIDPMEHKTTFIDSTWYCSSCRKNNVKIMDSIDLNKDGVKEVFIYREWHCFVTPSNMGPYGVGGQQQTITQYEVWDTQANKKIFKIKNTNESKIAITTNVMRNFGYRYAVEIDKKGTIYLSNTSSFDDQLKIRTYQFDVVTGTYSSD